MSGLLWLSIKRYDKDAIRDWREFQKIKNLIAGEEREGFELYPKGETLGVGFNERLIVEGHDNTDRKGGTRQRPFKERPKDCLSLEQVEKISKRYMEDLKNESNK